MAKFSSQEVTALQEGGNQVDVYHFFSDFYEIFFPLSFMLSASRIGLISVFYSQRAKEIYFKEWDPQRHSVPDSRLTLIYILLYL